MELKELAKTLYFNKVLVESWRNDFVKLLETHIVKDKRNEGYMCSYCGTIAAEKTAFPEMNNVIVPRQQGVDNEIWIVNAHYDGCRGWD